MVSSLPIKGVDFLLGNDLAGDRVSVPPVVVDSPIAEAGTEALEEEFPGIFPACVVTRSQAREAKRDLEESSETTNTGVFLAETFFHDLDTETENSSSVNEKPVLSRESLVREQKADSDLHQIRQTEIDDVPEGFYLKNDVRMRKWRNPCSPAIDNWCVVHQVVLPTLFRQDVLRLAHEAPMAGHLGIRKTQSRLMTHFYWPQLHRDVVKVCRTCHECQVIGQDHWQLHRDVVKFCCTCHVCQVIGQVHWLHSI